MRRRSRRGAVASRVRRTDVRRRVARRIAGRERLFRRLVDVVALLTLVGIGAALFDGRPHRGRLVLFGGALHGSPSTSLLRDERPCSQALAVVFPPLGASIAGRNSTQGRKDKGAR